jgi:hypothetical protein
VKTREYIYVERMLALLIEGFGDELVRRAFANVVQPSAPSARRRNSVSSTQRPRSKKAMVVSSRDNLTAMKDFLAAAEAGRILRGIDDIRQLATFAGLKALPGRSRRDLLRSLVRSLDTMPEDKILTVIREAQQISAARRSDGLAVLTDKILEGIGSDSMSSEKLPRR